MIFGARCREPSLNLQQVSSGSSPGVGPDQTPNKIYLKCFLGLLECVSLTDLLQFTGIVQDCKECS